MGVFFYTFVYNVVEYERHNTYRFNYGIITTNNTDIDFGKKKGIYPYAITEGKWAREMVDFCKNENIEIDFSELGLFD